MSMSRWAVMVLVIALLLVDEYLGVKIFSSKLSVK